MLDPMTIINQITASYRAMSDTFTAVMSTHIDDSLRQHFVYLNETINGLYEASLNLYREHISLAEENLIFAKQITNLEQQLARHKTHHLYSPYSGTLVYTPSDAIDPPDPSRWLCKSCFDKQVNSPLQTKDGQVWRCTFCSFKLKHK